MTKIINSLNNFALSFLSDEKSLMSDNTRVIISNRKEASKLMKATRELRKKSNSSNVITFEIKDANIIKRLNKVRR